MLASPLRVVRLGEACARSAAREQRCSCAPPRLRAQCVGLYSKGRRRAKLSVIPLSEVPAEFHEAVRSALIGLGEADTRVVDASILPFEDAGGSTAWRLTLFLTRPTGDAWNVDRTRALKREARSVVDRLASERDETQDGLTSVLITTRDAPLEQTAPDEEPDPAERTDALDFEHEA